MRDNGNNDKCGYFHKKLMIDTIMEMYDERITQMVDGDKFIIYNGGEFICKVKYSYTLDEKEFVTVEEWGNGDNCSEETKYLIEKYKKIINTLSQNGDSVNYVHHLYSIDHLGLCIKIEGTTDWSNIYDLLTDDEYGPATVNIDTSYATYTFQTKAYSKIDPTNRYPKAQCVGITTTSEYSKIIGENYEDIILFTIGKIYHVTDICEEVAKCAKCVWTM